jgi:tyrosine-protein kinase Etk/Wzc
MIEQTNGISINNSPGKDNSWTVGPKDFVLKYLRYLPWVIICVAFALVIAFLKIRWATPIYHVESSMLIKDERDNTMSKDQQFNEMFLAQPNINLDNEILILRSSSVIERVVRDLDFQTQYYSKGSVRSSLLYPKSPFYLQVIHFGDSTSGFSFLMKILDENQFLIGTSKKPIAFGQVFERNGNSCILFRNKEIDLHIYPPDLNFRVTWQSATSVAGQIIGNLKVVQTNEQATALTLSFDGESSTLGKDILNTLMAVYDTLIIEDKSRVSSNTSAFIQQSLDTLQLKLGGSESEIKNFMLKNDIFDAEEQSKNYLGLMSDADKSITEQEVKVGTLNMLINYIEDSSKRYELVPVNLGIDEPVLTRLVEQYNTLQTLRESHLKTAPEANPLIVSTNSTLEKTRRDIREALLKIKQAYVIGLTNLLKKNGEAEAQIKSLPGKTMGLSNIQTQKKILEDLYSFLLQKKYETNISSAATVANSKIIEPAVSSGNPVKPDKKSIYSLYVLLGMLIPIGIIVIIELLRDKVASRLDVEKRTNAPILGEIGHSGESQNLVVNKNSRRFIAEQFRIIRSNLQYVLAKKERPVIMVTSSFSGEGKSFISTNMGAVMALTGKKTVIMEFDIRKPKIISSLNLKRKMGITNYMIGKANFDELPLAVEGFDNLYIIPCGPVPPNPSELLLDGRLDDLMKEVKEKFEVVIMDTAPVGLVSDAVNLGRYADCTLFIIRQNHTYRKQLRFIDDLYIEKKLPSISLLLNDIKAGGGYYGYHGYYGGYGYGYGYGYGHDYGSGYFEDDVLRDKNRSIFKKTRRWIRQLFG